MAKDHNLYIIPENFKSGDYILNQYRPIDLVILTGGAAGGLLFTIISLMIAAEIKSITLGIAGPVIGIAVIGTAVILTMKVNHYHNLLGRLQCLIRFMKKNKSYVFRGIDYFIYEEETDLSKGADIFEKE